MNDLNINSQNWVGVVESNLDPLKNGGCRVRIIGTHSFDTLKVPLFNLPVAQLVVSPNSGSNYNAPKPGDWVTGSYLDGPNKQWPVITGLLRGTINPTIYVNMTGSERRAYDNYVKSLPKSDVETPPVPGDPDTAPLARGVITGTSVEMTNSMRRHACDITLLVNETVAKSKVFVGQIIAIIRKGIVAVLKALDISPGTSSIISFLNDVKDTLKAINKFLNDVILEIVKLTEAIARIRAVIEYILSLPQRILALFRDCLNKLYAQLASAVFQIVSDASAEVESAISLPTSEFLEVVKETQQLTQNAITIASAPAAIVDSLYRPSGMSEQEQEQLTAEIFPGIVNFKRENFQGV
jgi:hypothetical protein